MENKVISRDIFTSNGLSITFTGNKVYLDFKNEFPTSNHQSEITNNIKHNVVMLDPIDFGEFVIVLKKVAKDYEKRYGKIPKKKIQQIKESKKEPISYVG